MYGGDKDKKKKKGKHTKSMSSKSKGNCGPDGCSPPPKNYGKSKKRIEREAKSINKKLARFQAKSASGRRKGQLRRAARKAEANLWMKKLNEQDNNNSRTLTGNF